MNGWKDFEMDNKMSVMNTGVGDQLASVASETVKQQFEQLIRDYRRVTVDEIAAAFNMSHGSAYNVVQNDLRYRKVCSRWVPRQLSDDHKRARRNCDRRRVLGVPL